MSVLILQRRFWLLPALTAIGFAGSLALLRALPPSEESTSSIAPIGATARQPSLRLVNIPAATGETPRAVAPTAAAPSAATQPAQPAAAPSSPVPIAAQSSAPNDVNRWLAEAIDPGNRRRAVAITRLASAPRYEATPVLKTLSTDDDG